MNMTLDAIKAELETMVEAARKADENQLDGVVSGAASRILDLDSGAEMAEKVQNLAKDDRLHLAANGDLEAFVIDPRQEGEREHEALARAREELSKPEYRREGREQDGQDKQIERDM